MRAELKPEHTTQPQQQQQQPRQEEEQRRRRGAFIVKPFVWLRSGKPVGWILAFATVLALLAAALIAVGGHDATLSSANIAVGVSSVALLFTGVLLLIAASQLLALSRRSSWKEAKRPPCKPAVLIAFLAIGLFGVYVLFSALKTTNTQRPYVVVAAALLIVFAIVGLLIFGKDARVTLPRVGTIALGLIGTILGAWQFWYQNHYVPSHAGSDVSLSTSLKLLSQHPDYDLVRATIDYSNEGGGSVSVIGSTYTLTGARIVRCPRPSITKTVQPYFQNSLPDPQRSRYMATTWEEQPADVLAAGKFVRDGKRLNAKVPAEREFVLTVPRKRYQLLRLRAQLLAIPGSVPLAQQPPSFHTLKGGSDNELYGFWHIEDDSWLHDLVSGRERWVILRYELVNPLKATTRISPDLRVTVRFPNPTWTHKPPSDSQITSLFKHNQTSDASEPFGDAELPLEPIAIPTAQEASKLPGKKLSNCLSKP